MNLEKDINQKQRYMGPFSDTLPFWDYEHFDIEYDKLNKTLILFVHI